MCLKYLAPLGVLWTLVLTPAGIADTLSVPGTGDGIEILQALAQTYAQATPAAAIDIPPSIGSGGGIAAVADGRAALGRIARPLSASEAGAGLTVVPVMRIPAAFFVHSSAGVQGLSFSQLAGIYSGAVTNWSEVGGPDLRIRVVRRENEDSTLKILRATLPGWQSLTITPRSKTAVTTQEAVETVMQNEGAIGFGPSSTAIGKGLTILKLEGLEPAAPGYPSAVTVSLIYKGSELNGEAEGFVKFVRSEPAKLIIGKLGALPWNN